MAKIKRLKKFDFEATDADTLTVVKGDVHAQTKVQAKKDVDDWYVRHYGHLPMKVKISEAKEEKDV